MDSLQDFAKMNMSRRPVPFWSWNEKLNKEELFRQMRAMKEAGYGGFFMHSRVGLVTKYLSDEWLSLIYDCSVYAKELGMNAYLYDEDMWPSGYASGIVPKASETFRERALVLIPEDQITLQDIVVKSLVTDEGERFICMRTVTLGNPRFNGGSYIDIFNPHAIRAFLDSTHERYARKFGKELSTLISGIFTDEPCYGIHWFYECPHVTYSPYLRERFLSEKGYDILDCAEFLFLDDVKTYPKAGASDEAKRIRADYYECASLQFTDSFTKQYANWCKEQGIPLMGHLMAEETAYEQAQWTAGVMPSYEYMDIPGVDKLFRNLDQLVTLKQLTSVTEQLEKPYALSECFAGLGHESGMLGRKKILDWQAVNGINFVNMHLSHYCMRGERKRDYPPNMNGQQPYFDDERVFSDYVARLNVLASMGKRSVEILVVSPLTSVLSEYSPYEKDNEKTLKEKYDIPFEKLLKSLQASHLDFHIGDETILSRHGRVENGKLVVGAHTYSVVILPPVFWLKPSTKTLLSNVAHVVGLGEFSDDINYAAPYTSRDDLVKDLLEFVPVLIHDDKDENVPSVIVSERVCKNGNIYLFANTGNKDEKVVLKFKDKRPKFVLEIGTGKAYRASTLENTSAYISVTLLNFGSLAIWSGDIDELTRQGLQIEDCPSQTRDGAVFYKTKRVELCCRSVRVLGENILPLEHAKLTVAGETRTAFVHLQNIWHYLFYPLLDGTPFTLEYPFYVRDLPQGKISLAIECAENYDCILLNGKVVIPSRKKGEVQVMNEKAFTDVCLTRCDVTGMLIEGENRIVLSGIKQNNISGVCSHRSVTEKEHYPTEAEAIYILGDFSVEDIGCGISDEKNKALVDGGKDNSPIAMRYVLTKAHSITVGDMVQQGYPFYSGKVEYDFAIDDNFEKSMFQASGDMVTLRCDTEAVCSPFVWTCDEKSITESRRSGHIRVVISNSLFGMMGPHYLKGYDELLWVDPGIFNHRGLYTNEYYFKPFGLYKLERLIE